MRTVPSRFCSMRRPMRSSTVGSCRTAGRYSLAMIEGGTFQVGLTVMNFIPAVMIGVACVGLPTTILVSQYSFRSWNSLSR